MVKKCYKDISVEEVLAEGEGRREWHVKVLQNLSDWQIKEYESLLSVLSPVSLSGAQDQLLWTLSSTGQFTVETFIGI